MVAVYTDSRMLEHVPSSGHPERPERLATVLRHLTRTGQLGVCRQKPLREATDAELLRVHTEGHLEFIKRMAGQGSLTHVEEDTWVSPGSHTAARLAAGACVDAVEAVVKGDDKLAMCLVRPPGHHALADGPMGFCLFGNIAVAAAHATRALGLNRVMVVDWDVHHGNGTQEMFYEDPSVSFLSIHRYPFYPGSGAADETGTGPGLGTKVNVPIAFGTSPADYLAAFRSSLEALADRTKPELILLSAGFDAHAEDPVGSLGLDFEHFETMTKQILEVAKVHCGGRLVSVLEGGYNLSILAGCVSAHLEVLIDHD